MLKANSRQPRRSWRQAMGRVSQTALNEWQKAFCQAWLIIGVDSSMALARGGLSCGRTVWRSGANDIHGCQ